MNEELIRDIQELNGLNIDMQEDIVASLRTTLRPFSEEWCMLLTGMQSGHQSGIMADILSVLEELSIKYHSYSVVESGASLTLAHLALKAFRRSGASVLLAAGGGSVISTAKFIATSARSDQVSVPLIVLPTAPGCGSLSTRLAVLMDHRCKHCISIVCTLNDERVLLNPSYFRTLSPAVSISAFLGCLVAAAEFILAGGTDAYPDCWAVYLRLLVQTYKAWTVSVKPFLSTFDTQYLKRQEFITALIMSAIDMGLLQNKIGIGLLVYLGSAISHRHGCTIYKGAAQILAPLMRLQEELLPSEARQLYEAVGARTIDELGRIITDICTADGEGLIIETNEGIADIVLSIDHALPLIPHGSIGVRDMKKVLEAGCGV